MSFSAPLARRRRADLDCRGLAHIGARVLPREAFYASNLYTCKACIIRRVRARDERLRALAGRLPRQPRKGFTAGSPRTEALVRCACSALVWVSELSQHLADFHA